MLRRVPCALTLLTLVACDDPKPARAPSETEATAKAAEIAPTKTASPAVKPEPAPPERAPIEPTAGAPAVPKPATPTAPAITKEARAEYRARLDAGRKLAKAQKWTEAIVEFDAALVAIPGDDRALGELSWAAFSAGDYPRARQAANASVRAATAPKVEGAALYNLGRAEEASGNLADARAAYEASIAVRPNATVSARLAALAAPTTPVELECSTAAPQEAICACLLATIDPEIRPADPECSFSPSGVDDFQFVTHTVSEVGESRTMIAVARAAGWAVVGEMAQSYNPGMMGISEEWTQEPTVERTVGTKRIVEFRGHLSRSDTDMGIDEIESEDSDVLVVCVAGDHTTPTTCPLRLVTKYSYVRERLAMDDDPEVDALRTPGLPIRNGYEVAVEIDGDGEGVARVRRISGKPDAGLLGDTKLW